MKFVCISDTHQDHKNIKLPKGDIILHSGDFTKFGKDGDAEIFNEWGEELKLEYKHLICIGGNHEKNIERIGKKRAKDLLYNWTYLEDEMITIEGINIYGCPWQPRFYDWAFNLPRKSDQLKQAWENIPEETNILLTHTPPHHMLDLAQGQNHAGCELLADEINSGRLQNLKYHIFGHIHESYGMSVKNGITFINAAMCNNFYKCVNKPFVFSL